MAEEVVAVWPGQLADVADALDELHAALAPVIATGLKWKLENVIALVAQLDDNPKVEAPR